MVRSTLAWHPVWQRFLEAACRGRTATPELAEKVGRFLDQAQRNSQLRFEAS